MFSRFKIQDYRKCLEFLFLAMESLIQIELEMFSDFINADGDCSKLDEALQRLKEFNWDDKKSRKVVLENALNETKEFSSEFFIFVAKLNDKSENWNMMNQFIWEDCSSLVQLLISIQSGNHDDRIIALKRINRSFFAWDAINYKRWGILDMALKASHFPDDLLKAFKDSGIWRGNFTTNINSFMPSDQIHEQGFNLPLKSQIISNRHSDEIGD